MYNALPKAASVGLPYATLQTPDADVTIESIGGKVSSWKIKEKDHWLQMLLPETNRKRSPMEFASDLTYHVEKISNSKAVLTAARSDGLLIKKTISLSEKPPFHQVELILSNTGKTDVIVADDWGWGRGLDKHLVDHPYDKRSNGAITAEQSAAAYDGQHKKWRPGFIFGRTVDVRPAGAFEWVGVGNNHFVAAMIGIDKPLSPLKVQADRSNPPLVTIPVEMTLKPGESFKLNTYWYVGPKKYDELKTFGYHLDQTVDFGRFGFISKTLLFLLKKFESMTGNYGWAIILLTFVIQIVVFPLTIKNFKHSLRMKELQPQMKKIQEQFKSDPKRLQVETFNLYKKHGMKFMGMEGCFPVLLQIPIFFAFYSTLNVAYELRGAPWIFWIHDLGQSDPYFVLPIIMGLGMFLQQKLTAVAMDPSQARMMMFMPVMFTFMFLKLPAGLVLYWCVNSITNILITQVMKRQGPSPAAT
jgi:YidC/Oxa1 family membrane protein insertase